MFSIVAINDTDSKGQWEPLAPSKEAQEFHLSQTYHEGLHKLHAKEYEKARESFESILKDPLISSAQEVSSANDGHLLHLRFLALRNLASVFLQQGSAYYEKALHCYLQAVEIDAKDSVVWNQLGTLSCSMGLLSISRWAFEQGLVCSPNNWIFMEKLLEVLIAIGDEVACLTVAEMILRHWPSHSRAVCVKSTIEESEIVPFAPRGIDKLEPKHARLKFSEKRKSPDENLDGHSPPKKLKPNIEIKLAEASWHALADALLDILLPLCGCKPNGVEKELRSGDVCLNIQLLSCSETVKDPFETKGENLVSFGDDVSQLDLNGEKGGTSKEQAVSIKEQPQERRSTRLERMRTHKPEKEEAEFAASKDNAEVIKFLEPFIAGLSRNEESSTAASCSAISCEEADSLGTECSEVARFVRDTSSNFGAYHLAHLLLEEAANTRLGYQDAFIKFLSLEKLSRDWGQDRTPGCCLFLAELYYDLGLSFEAPELSDFVVDASYHLCKMVECVAMDHCSSSGNGCVSFLHNFQGFGDLSGESAGVQSLTLRNLFPNNDKCSFWVRFFWLSGRLAVLDDKKANAYQQFCMALSILSTGDDSDHRLLVGLPHCKTIKELTIDRLLYEINMLKVDVSLEKEVQEMYEKQMYLECINLLAPLLFCTKDTYLDVVASRRRMKGIASRELFALELLIKACDKTKPMLIDVCLTCHQRKLQNLLAAAGIDEFPFSCKIFPQKPESTRTYILDADKEENSSNHWSCLVAEEVKAISHCALLVKNSIDSADSNDVNIPTSSIHDIQLLLLTVMCNIARILSSKKSVLEESVDLIEQKQRCCFIDAAIAFCKFQFLDLSMPIKSQVELIVAIHDLLAEYGLCCAGEGKEGEEGTYLRFAIKHLLALDMKLKSTFHSLNGEATHVDRQLREDGDSDSGSVMLHLETIKTGVDEVTSIKKGIAEGLSSNGDLSQNFSFQDNFEDENERGDAEYHDNKIGGGQKQATALTDEVTENEKEELEMKIDNALDQCFFCLYGLNLRSDSSYEDELAMHKNTSRGEYQTKEQSADVFQYLLPYAKGSSKTGLVKLRRVLRAIRKHFPQPPESVLTGNPIDRFLDDLDLCEDKLSEDSGSEGFFQMMINTIFSSSGNLKQYKKSLVASSEQYVDVYCNLYFFLAQSEEMSATDKWPGFVLTKEGEEFVQQNANLFKYDLLYNPLRFESWQRLANIYDEEVDLLLNDGSKHINVLVWRKNATLSQRVETSRRRSRRCLLMSLALAKTPAQQCEIHELLALVYYDSLQNVAPLYDQRCILPARDAAWIKFCENSMKHFKKAFANKPDWSHAFYMGKLSEKLGYAHETYLSYYDKAIALNRSAVDPVYRMHASRIKLLCKFGPQNVESLKVVSAYSFSVSTKAAVIDNLDKIDLEVSPMDIKEEIAQTKAGEKAEESYHLEDAWNVLYNDCLAALETCLEGDLKHFHKARYMLAQGFYRRGRSGDMERAKEELSFCFKSSRSSFTVNMWEIDGMVKKGRRRTPNVAANKKALEVILPESSRKFITCIRKYILFYLKLLEEARDISTLDKAFISIKADKRFSLCIEDIVPVALARYIRGLIASSSPDYLLEKLFSLFMEQGNIWPDVCSLPEMNGPDTSESRLYGYLQQYIHILERSSKLETIEAINEKLRKRFKNPKLSNSNCAKVCRHASVAWCRSLIISLAAITPLESGQSTEIQSDERLESTPLLCIDLQTNELWNSQFEDATQLKAIEMKWTTILSKIKNMVIRKVFYHHSDTANSLLRCSYNFYRDSSCVTLPNAVNLYLVSHGRLAAETAIQTATQGIEVLDLSIPRKLLLWAYTLLHGHCPSISIVVKYCEENLKPKTKKGTGAASTSTSASSTMATQTGGGKDSAVHSTGREGDTAPASIVLALPESSGLSREWQDRNRSSLTQVTGGESNRNLFSAPQLQHCNNSIAEKNTPATHDQGVDDVNAA